MIARSERTIRISIGMTPCEARTLLRAIQNIRKGRPVIFTEVMDALETEEIEEELFDEGEVVHAKTKRF